MSEKKPGMKIGPRPGQTDEQFATELYRKYRRRAIGRCTVAGLAAGLFVGALVGTWDSRQNEQNLADRREQIPAGEAKVDALTADIERRLGKRCVEAMRNYGINSADKAVEDAAVDVISHVSGAPCGTKTAEIRSGLTEMNGLIAMEQDQFTFFMRTNKLEADVNAQDELAYGLAIGAGVGLVAGGALSLTLVSMLRDERNAGDYSFNPSQWNRSTPGE